VHLHSPLDEHTPPATRVLPNITMADLRDELMRRRGGGGGGRIVASPSSATVKGTATSRAATSREILNLLRLHEKHLRRMSCANPSSPATFGECKVLVPHLRMVVWLRNFRPHLSEKYDGTINPT
jgi:hypothetical protein